MTKVLEGKVAVVTAATAVWASPPHAFSLLKARMSSSQAAAGTNRHSTQGNRQQAELSVFRVMSLI